MVSLELVLLATAALITLRADAYAILGARRFIRPVRSAWRPAAPPAAPAYYPYPSYVGGSSDYEEETPEEGALYSDTVNYYPPPRYYYGRTLDPVDDLQMEMRNEERGSDLPIGQETWFERQTAAQAAAAERAAANDAFMQNLILAEMYRNSEPSAYYGYGGADEEERELKSLSQVKRTPPRVAQAAGQAAEDTSAAPEATAKPFVGQKEVAMLRPPNPARKPAGAVPGAASKPPSGGHAPSVYDTIKHLLTIEGQPPQHLHDSHQGEHHSPPQKRFVSSEESLVRQLSSLKNKVTA